MTVTYQHLTVEWYGYATVRLATEETVVYLDPGRYGVLSGEWEANSEYAADAHPSGEAVRPTDADFVCLSHVHHYDPDGIERVANTDTTVVFFEGINIRDSPRDLDRLVELPFETTEIGAEDQTVIDDVPVWTVPAYNRPDGPHTTENGTPYHAEGTGCGFLLSIEGIRVFWPGDTDVLDGHAALDVDVFLPPIGGTFTMDRTEAAALTEEMEPELVVPIHYNTFEEIETDAEAFTDDLGARGIAVQRDETPFSGD